MKYQEDSNSHIYTQLRIMWYIAISVFVIAFISTAFSA